MPRVINLRYPEPATTSPVTAWATGWRSRWFLNVGAVCEHHEGGLVACYADDRDPTVRTTLQRELEEMPGGVAQVLAACRHAAAIRDAEVFGVSA